jgi:outer membrane protein OmpA-like peptidoglycan-associated protein
MMKHRFTACLALALLGSSGSAFAQTATSAKAPEQTPPAESDRKRPARFELGFFGGVFFPSKKHELAAKGPFQKYASKAPELGGRLGVYPLDFLGLEVEGAAMPTKVADGSSAGLWAARAHLVGQAPLGAVIPFAVFGAGALGAGSNALGSDSDPAIHFGVGAKVPLDDFLSLRLDLRDTMSQKHNASQGAQTHHPEATLGLSFNLRPGKAPPEAPKPAAGPADSDNDGVSDDKDACPAEPGEMANGCPRRDTDGDGFSDDKDACPKQAGSAPCGCSPVDTDGDKVIDELDRCPGEAGPIEGCPDPDADRDGIPVPQDRCPDKQETKNGYEDSDGCPDEIPEVIKKFTGVIQGIEFDRGKETIRPVSTPTLDAALKVLNDYPALRVLISGHTDTDGVRQTNLDLSRRRAESVKAYFVGKGVDSSRIETRGAGPDEPIADNKTAAGKQKNRRIEFKLIDEAKRPDEAKSPEKGQP